MQLVKLLYFVIANLYIWLLMPIIDLLFNFPLFAVSFIYKKSETDKRLIELEAGAAEGPVTFKDNLLKNMFAYAPDPLKGIINWNWRSWRVAAFLNFRGDCDDFAHLAHWFYKDGKKYSIIPIDPRNWNVMHVVYCRKNRIYSGSSSAGGQVYRFDLKSYLEWCYDSRNIDYIIVRMW